MTWQFVLAGLAVGVLVGHDGNGRRLADDAGARLHLRLQPATAIGTDILHGAIFKSVGGLRHHSLGTTQAKLSGWMFVGSAPASLLGVSTATWLKHRYGDGIQSTEGVVLGAALLIGGVGMLLKSIVRVREVSDAPFVMRTRDKVAAVAIGLFGGYIVGLSSVGSGVFFGLTLLIVFPLRAHKVVGTDILHAAGLLWVAGFGHLVAGNVDLHAVAWLLVGSIPGILAGSQFSIHVADRSLRILLSLVLFASGAKLVAPNGNGWLVASGAYIAFTVATMWAVHQRGEARLASVARVD